MNKRLAIGKTKRIGNFWYLRRRKAAQVALTVCCFALPILCLPLVLRDSGTNLWVRMALPRAHVRQIIAPAGETPLRYALTADSGVFRSTDDGMTWQLANNGLPRDSWGRTALQTLAVVEGAPAVAYAGVGFMLGSNTALNTGLYMTEDAAATWSAVGSEMAGKEVQAIAVMRGLLGVQEASQGRILADAAAATNVVYVATSAGILRSLDGSRSWSRLDWRGMDSRILCLSILPGDADVIYVGTQGAGLYGTWNAGETWKEMNRGLEDLDISCIAIASHDPSVMYVATNGGVFKSTNAGSSWAKSSGPVSGRRVTVITLSPADDNLVYAGLEYGGVFRSTDGGEHWIPLKKGLGDLTVFSLAVDPRDPANLWAGTTDGVWRYVPELSVQADLQPAAHATSATLVQGEQMPAATEPTHTATVPPSPTVPVKETPGITAAANPSATRSVTPPATRILMPSATRAKPAPTRTLSPSPSSQPTPEATQLPSNPPAPPPPAAATALPR